MKTSASIFLFVFLSVSAPLGAQDPSPEAIAAYEEWRAWVNVQPEALFAQGDAAVEQAYREYLTERGVTGTAIDTRIALIKAGGQALEIARWNRILTAENPTFNTEPNAFLVRMAATIQLGRALDVGMGQGRNAIWLAQQGWDVTGFDPAGQAVALAQQMARAAGVTITTQVVGSEAFDWGTEQWDLIVMSYVGTRAWVDTIQRALRPGGHVLVEAFHFDALADGPIGRGVVYESNELLELFSEFRVIHYEDAAGIGDFGQTATRVVRLFARKE
jgi:SAM-dependent methyltransferase